MAPAPQESATLKLACRFVPHDQWLVTHAESNWKVRILKLSILTKCTTLATHPSNVERAATGKRHASISHDHHHHRPRRPVSPIRFASNARMQSSVLEPTATSTTLDDSDNWIGHEQDDEDEDIEEVSNRQYQYRKHFDSAFMDVQVVSSGQGGTVIKPTPSHNPRDSTTSLNFEPLEPAYDPQHFTLVRFTTGQILEDNSSLDWYNLRPEELLELHPAGAMIRLQRHVIPEYIEPYWEGWVKSLRRVFEVDNRGQSRVEWRERWLVIQNGMITLHRSQEDSTPTQIVPLSALTSLQGPNRLTRTVEVTPEQRVFCAKFEPVSQSDNESDEDEESNSQAQEAYVSVARPAQGQHQRDQSLQGGAQRHRSFTGIQVQIRKNTASASILSISRKETVKKSASSNLRHRLSALSLRSTSAASVTTDTGGNKASSSGWKRFSQRLREQDESSPSGQPPSELGAGSEDDGDPDDRYAQYLSDAPIEFARAESAEGFSDDDNSSNESSRFSSPVFAPGREGFEDGSDEGASDTEHIAAQRQRMSYGFYGYGYGSRTKERLKSDERDNEMEFDHMTGDSSTTHIQEERSHRPSHNRKRDSRRRSYREKETGEWIVLDMLDNPAYISILRILHRHARPSLSSSFVSSFPVLQASESYPGPVEEEAKSQPSTFESESSETFEHKLNKLPSILTNNLSTDFSQSHHHPSPLREAHSQSRTLGALPYPEWRHEVTEKAQVRGLNATGSLQMFYFGKVAHLKEPSTFPPPDPLFNEAASRKSYQSSSSSLTAGRQSSSAQSSDDESEFEWHAWMGDLGRMSAARTSGHHAFASDPLPRRDYTRDRYVKDRDIILDEPRSQAEDYEYLLNERLCLEPSASIYVEPPSPPRSPSPPAIQKRPMHDTSPSSTGGRRNRTMSFGMAGVDATSVGEAANALLSQSQGGSGVGPVAVPRPSNNQSIGYRRPSLPDLFPASRSASDKTPTTPGGSSSLGKSLNIRHQVSSSQIGGPQNVSRSLGKSSLGRVGSNLLRKKGSDPGEGFNKYNKGKKRVTEEDLVEEDREGRSQQWSSVSSPRQGRSATSPGSPDFASYTMSDQTGPEADKKKRIGLVRGMSRRADKIVKGLEPALNFVDGK